VKTKRKGKSIAITFDNRREAANVLGAMGLLKTAEHLHKLQDLADLDGMTPAAIFRLRGIGVETLAELKAEDPKIIAYVAEVSAERVALWLACETPNDKRIYQ
jgi:hypothetical protein